MAEKILNYFSMLQLLKQKADLAELEVGIDFSLDGYPYIEFTNLDGDVEVKWTKKDTLEGLSCGEVLFNDFVEVEYWLSNCMDDLLPSDESAGWTVDLLKKEVAIQSTEGCIYVLSAHDIANGIKNSDRKLFNTDELREIYREVAKVS